MSFIRYTYRIFLVSILCSLLFFALNAHAQTDVTAPPTTGLAGNQIEQSVTVPRFTQLIRSGLIRYNLSTECDEKGKCSIQDLFQIAVNIQTFLFGITGGILLLVFIIGGLTWITSGGNQTKIQKGLHTLRDAFIGLVIVLSAYAIVNIVISVLTSPTGSLPSGDSTIEETIDRATGGDTAGSLINTQNE